MVSGAVLGAVLASLAVAVCFHRLREGSARVARQLDAVTAVVEASARRHATDMRGLQVRLDLAEHSVQRAEDDTINAATVLSQYEHDLLPRVQRLESPDQRPSPATINLTAPLPLPEKASG